jgi:hypothetical protein
LCLVENGRKVAAFNICAARSPREKLRHNESAPPDSRGGSRYAMFFFTGYPITVVCSGVIL